MLADVPPHHVGVLASFTRWYLLPRARQSAHRRGIGDSAVTTIPSSALAAARLLAWLDTIHIGLADLTQSHVDEWLDTGQGHYRYLYPFITWARTHHLISADLRVPVPQYPQTLRQLEVEDRLAQLRRCLDDDGIPVHLRVAGTLTVLFGIPITTIVRLRHDDVTTHNGTTFLQIADRPLALPPKLATLVDQLAAQPPQPHGALGFLERASSLLFPGTSPERPMGANRLCGQLTAHGVTVLAARNSARLALAARLPAPVLASLSGIEVGTAVVWNERAGHDWAAFVAARASAQKT